MQIHYIYLIYGLSFVIMGFAMAYQSFSSFRVLPRGPLVLLAAFGITHGMVELQKMFQTLEMRGLSNASPAVVDYVTLMLIPLSFLLLLAFAVELLIHSEVLARWWRVLYLIAPSIVATLALIPGWSMFQSIADWPLRLEVATRLFMGFPAGFLSGFALIKLAAGIRDQEKHRLKISMYTSAFFLFAYGVVAGLLILNPAGFIGWPEHGVSAAPALLEARSAIAIGLTIMISYSFIIELANVEANMKRMRDEFSAVLAHDIGNIISAIKMSSDIINSDEALSKLGEKTQYLFKTIDSNAKLLQNLMSELFDLSLMELNRFHLDLTAGDLRQVIAQTSEQMRPIFGGRSLVVLMPDSELTAEFDRQRVGQILINLLSNAAKYSYLESEVIVSAYESGPDIKVSVASMGPVIPKDEAEQLFNRYYRSKWASTKKGSGLGLFIVKELVEAHKGTVFIETEESGKAVFGFTIPRKRIEGKREESSILLAE